MVYVLIYIFTCISLVNAHVFMSSPPSRRNKYSSFYRSRNLVDYNIMAPLNTPGYRFPCKGFPKGPPTAIFNSNVIPITFEGSATHGGGHCQFGITYDDNTFVVLKTVMRTCLIEGMSYQLVLPSNIPSGDVTLFWTWVNRIGGREYYMECADISIRTGNTNNIRINGLELLVVNLPGRQIIPEIPFDGSNLFAQRRSISIISRAGSNAPLPPNTPPNTPPLSTSTSSTRRTQPTSIPLPSTCITGYMLCARDTEYHVCVHNIWYKMKCPLGTICKNLDNEISCEF
jgi:hypothetical protein